MADAGSSAPSLGAADGSAGPDPRRLLARWWPALVGVALGVASLLTVEPWSRTDPPTLLLPGLAIAYLAFGAARGRLRRPGVLRLEIAGLLIGASLIAAPAP